MVKPFDAKTLKGLITLFLLVLLISREASAQNEVAIGSSTTKSNAILWLNGNGSQGLILPIVTSKTAVASPDKGMIIYDNTDNKVWYRSDNAWVEVGGGTAVGDNGTLSLLLLGNQLELRDGTKTLSILNIAGGTATNGSFMVWNGTSWQFASLNGDVTGTNGALKVDGIKGKTVPALPTTTQALVYDGTAWKFQALTSSDSQDLSLNTTTNILSLTNDPTPVDLTPYKQTLTLTGNNLGISGGNTVTLPSSPITSISGTAPVTVTPSSGTPVVSMAQANGTTNGYLSSADHITFSGKVSLGGDLGGTAASPLVTKIQGISVSSNAPALNQVLQFNGTNWLPTTLAASGDITDVIAGTGLSGGGASGSVTLNLTNSGVVQGIYGGASSIPQLTIDSQGRITAVTTSAPVVADGSVTGGTAGLGVKIAANTITDANISSLNAGKITSGTLPTAQVPNLDASKITSGTFAVGQIPGLDASKITSGIIPTTQGGTGLSLSGGSINQGQLLIGTGGAFAKANLTAGNGMIITNGAGTIALAVDAGTTANKIVQLDGTGKLPAVDGSLLTNLPIAGDITDVTAGTGLTGGGTTGAVTLNLANTAITPATYGTTTTIPQITIDQQGRITSANNQTIPTANSTTTGLLSTADWNTFNSKGSGTVTSVSVATANGISGTVATATSTPAITLTLGAITPTSVAASGAITGSNLSGTNTGDQTNITGNAATVTTNANLTGPVTSVGNATSIGAGVIINAMLANAAVASLSGTNTGDQTNITGNAATVTTNANLTGPVTSIGNATSIGAGAITNAMLANGAVANLSGTNTGDQINVTGNAATVTTNANLTGPVTSVGNATAIANGAITNAMLANAAVASLSGINTGDQTNVTGNAATVTTNANLTGPVTSIGNATTIANGAVSGGTGGIITDLTIDNNDIATNAAIDGSKVVPTFGAQNISTTGTLSVGGSATLSTLAGSGSQMVVVDNAGLLGTQALPSIFSTLNTIPKGDGTTLVASSIFDDGANVGIGSVSPLVKLSVRGRTYIHGNGDATDGDVFAPTIDLAIDDNDTGFEVPIDGQLAIFANNVEQMRINGNIGIGTTTPTAKLDIAGNIKIADGTEGAGKVLTSDGVGLASWQAAASGWGLTGNGLTVDGTNFIGTTDNIPLNFQVSGQKSGRIDHILGNTHFGYQAGNASTTGVLNVAIGRGALLVNSIGAQNTAVGEGALIANTASFNTAVGQASLVSNTSGTRNAAFGMYSLDSNNTGNDNTAVGMQALFNNTSGSNNTALGVNADVQSGTLSNATAIGANAKVGTSNSLVLGGTGAFAVNVGIGTASPTATLEVAGQVKITGGTPGLNKVLTSDAAGLASWQPAGAASGWAFTGNTIAAADYIGSNNDLAFNIKVNNQKAGRIESDVAGNGNVWLGYRALEVNTGTDNTAFGTKAMAFNTSASNNTAVGRGALILSTTGFGSNAAIGSQALAQNTTGYRNTSLGYLAGSTTSGPDVVGVGITTGDNNTFIGSISGPLASGTLVNATALGANVKVSASNTMVFGSGVTKWGFGKNVAGANVIENSVNTAVLTNGGIWTNASDSTIKKNIKNITYGLMEVLQLRPVSYDMKNDSKHDIGFIAQEVKSILPEIVYGKDGEMSMSYGQITAVLTKAMQEQQKEIEELKAKLREKNDKVSTLENSVSSMRDELDNIKQALGMQANLKSNDKK